MSNLYYQLDVYTMGLDDVGVYTRLDLDSYTFDDKDMMCLHIGRMSDHIMFDVTTYSREGVDDEVELDLTSTPIPDYEDIPF